MTGLEERTRRPASPSDSTGQEIASCRFMYAQRVLTARCHVAQGKTHACLRRLRRLKYPLRILRRYRGQAANDFSPTSIQSSVQASRTMMSGVDDHSHRSGPDSRFDLAKLGRHFTKALSAQSWPPSPGAGGGRFVVRIEPVRHAMLVDRVRHVSWTVRDSNLARKARAIPPDGGARGLLG